MSEIFLKLVNMSITASWLVLAVVILRLVFKKAPKFIHCIMWVLVGIRLVFPFSIESVLSLIPSANTFPVENIYSSDQNIANNSYYHGVDSGVGFIDNALNPITYDASSPEVLRSNLDIISIVWLVGIAAMLVYTLVSYLRIYKRVSASICVKENTFICDDIDTPFILGVLRPRIYLPSSMSEADAEYVVAHEKAHLKRLDHLWKPLGFLILAVYWFNPVLWLAYFLLCRDIEFACDQKVIRELGLEIKKPYSDALINCSVPRRMLAACPLAFGETSVKSRIKSVLSFKKPAVWIIIASVLAVSIAAVCLLTNPKKVTPSEELLKYNFEPTEMVYCYTTGSFTQTPPMYSVTSDMYLQEIGNYDSVYTLGGMKELKLNNRNFNSKFEDDGWTEGYSAEFIRSNNKNAWQVNTEYATYILLEQKDGTYYIAKLSSKSLDINTIYSLELIEKETVVSSTFYQSDKAEEYGEYSTIGVTLNSDNTCEISFSMTGDFFYGSYEIDKNTLVCKLNKLQGEYIKDVKTDIEYHFDILDNDSLRFKKVVGKVGKYYSTIDNTEYVFEEQFSHFAKGDTFTPQKSSPDEDTTTSSEISGGGENVNASFKATVLEVYENYLLVEPLENQNISTLPIEVSKNVISQIPVPDLKVGSKIQIVYNGEIMESYPKQINKVFSILLIGAGSTDVPYKISYANYTTKSWIYTAALNTSKMYEGSQKHLPIYKFESREELEQFKASAAGSLSIDKSYDNIQSLNDATVEYGAEFFKDNALILTYISSNSSTWRYGVKEIYNDGKNFQLVIMRDDNNETGDSAMCGWYVTLEVKKSEIKNCTSFDAVCNDIDSGLSLPVQENVVSFNLDASKITKIAAIRKPSHKGDEVTVTSKDTISVFVSYFNKVQFKEYKNPAIEPSSEMITYITVTYNNGKTDTILLKSFPEYNGQKYRYTDYGDEGEMEKILFGAYEINREEKYAELTDKKITAVHILKKEKPIVNGSYQEKFVVSKSYTGNISQKLAEYLNTNHCEEKDVNDWVKRVAGKPEKYAVVACLEDNTTMVMTIHFDKGDLRNYIAITTLNEQFVVEEKSPEYLEHGYTRYLASEDFGQFILSILE